MNISGRHFEHFSERIKDACGPVDCNLQYDRRTIGPDAVKIDVLAFNS